MNLGEVQAISKVQKKQISQWDGVQAVDPACTHKTLRLN